MKLPIMTLSLRLIITGLMFSLGATVFAQRNPTMTEQRRDADKEALFAKFNQHKRIATGEEQRLAYEAAIGYLDRFEGDNDSNAKIVRKFVTEYQKFLREYELYKTYEAKNYLKTFEMGRVLLKSDPANFHVLAALGEAGYDNAQSGDATLNSETVGYLRKAIELLEGRKVAKPDPFENEQAAVGFLNFSLGWFIRTDAPVEAAAAFLKAARSNSSYSKNPLTYNLLGIAILKGEYAQVSSDYNNNFAAKPPSTEQQEMFKRLVHLADRAIDAYARAVALTTSPEQQEARSKMLARLTSLYKTFHNNSDEGLNELIASVLSKPVPQ